MDERKSFQAVTFAVVKSAAFLPYILFLSAVSGRYDDMSFVIPFVIFYTLSKTGLFIVRGFGRAANSFTLLQLALAMGIAGAFAGVLGYLPVSGTFINAFRDISGALIGFCASLSGPSYQTVSFHERSINNFSMGPKEFPLALGIVVVSLFAVQFSETRIPAFAFLLFAGLLSAASVTLTKLPQYRLTDEKKLLEPYSYSLYELIVSLLLVLIVASLRFSRQLADVRVFKITIAVLCVLFIVLIVKNPLGRIRKKVPVWFAPMTILNGMGTNFVLVYSALLMILTGSSFRLDLMYLCYGTALILAQFAAQPLYRLLRKIPRFTVNTIGIMLGLGLLISRYTFPAGVCVLSFFLSANSMLLNKRMYSVEEIAPEERLFIKYRLSTSGSILQQTILLAVLIAVCALNRFPVDDLLKQYSLRRTDVALEGILFQLRLICVIGLILFAAILGIVTFLQRNREAEVQSGNSAHSP